MQESGGDTDRQTMAKEYAHDLSLSPNSLVVSIPDLRKGGYWFDPPARLIFFPWIDDSHCDRIHSCPTTMLCFSEDYVGNQQVAWKEYCAEYWLKELQESKDSCTGCHDITEITMKTALNANQSINPWSSNMRVLKRQEALLKSSDYLFTL